MILVLWKLYRRFKNPKRQVSGLPGLTAEQRVIWLALDACKREKDPNEEITL